MQKLISISIIFFALKRSFFEERAMRIVSDIGNNIAVRKIIKN